jgi:DNA repair protein RecO (recombination protein O)
VIEKSEGTVLGGIRFGDTSRIVTVYTERLGLVKVIAKGARGPKPRYGAGLETFAKSFFLLYWRREKDLHLLKDADLVDARLPLLDDPARYALASAIVELTSVAAREPDPNPALYRALSASLDALSALSGAALLPAFRAAELHVLASVGLRPEFARCVAGGEEPAAAAFFSAAEGGVVCARCHEEGAPGTPVSAPALAALRFLERSSLEGAARFRGSPPVLAEIGRILDDFLTYHLERYRGLRSLRIYQALRSASPGGNGA